MKTYILLILFIFFACQPQKTKPNSYVDNFSKDNPIVDTTLITNGIKIETPIPIGVKIDSLKYYDKLRNAQVLIYFPVTGIIPLDTGIKAELIRGKNIFIKNVDSNINQNNLLVSSSLTSEFSAVPVSIYENEKIVSYSFMISRYIASAPHPITEYFSYNFSKLRQNKVNFFEFFNILSQADTSFFITTITKAINRKGVSLFDLKNIDFNVEPDTISFNFDDYEIASYSEGIMQGRVVKSKLKSKTNINYR